MGRSRYSITEVDSPHFLTCTIIGWTPVFTRPDTVQIILDSFTHLRQAHALKLYGYVILENHLHWIGQSADLPRDLARFKSYTAKRLVNYFEEHCVTRVLEQFAYLKKRHKRDSKHQVWQEDSHPQLIQDAAVLRNKLEYIHDNPVKRGYVDEPVHWRYSSARNYAGQPGLIEVYHDWS